MRVGFIYNMDYCTGCKACQVACKDKNDLPAGRFFRRVESLAVDGKRVNYSGACNHCEQAPCLESCPSGALFRADDGSVAHHGGRCIGCGACVWLCPYGAPFLSPSKGISQKCNGCAELRAQGLDPACVRACITHCLTFGPLPPSTEEECAPSFLPDPHLTKPALLIRRGAGTDLAASVSASSLSPATALLPDQSLQAEAYGYGRAVSDNRDVVVGLPEEGRGPAIGGNTSGGFPENERVLIIGGGAAGVSAAAAVRARNPVCDIIILSAEDQLSYSRPMLTKAALRGFDASAFTVFDEVWYLKHRIEFRKGISVAAIKPDSSEALLSDGSSISYDRCIIATGADCFIPPIPGRGLKRVFGIRDLKSTQAIRSALTTARKVVVIGGGVIGLEMAWEIKRAGCELTILELAPTLMGRLLDEQSAIDLADQLRRNGVVVRTGIKIEAIYAAATAGTGAPDDCVAGVRLADGTDFEADMVVVSCGIAPNTNLAKAVGCAVNRGILVNNYMETNVPGIYACGDCAEQENSSAGLWQTAVSQGSVAGAVAAGERKACLPEPAGLLMHGFGTCLYALGDAGKNPDLDYEVLECVNPDPKMFVVNDIQRQPGTARYFFVEDQLVGGVLMGNLLSMANLKKGIAEGLGRVGFKALKEGGG